MVVVKIVYCPNCGGKSWLESEPMLQYMEDWIYECPECEKKYIVIFKPYEDDPDVAEPVALIRLDISKEELNQIIEFLKKALKEAEEK